jgi:hypothetical protein
MTLEEFFTAYMAMLNDDEARDKFYANPALTYSSLPDIVNKDMWILFARLRPYSGVPKRIMLANELAEMAHAKGVGVDEIYVAFGELHKSLHEVHEPPAPLAGR